MVKAQEVKLGVPCLLGLQHDLKLRPLLADKVGRSLNDVVSLDSRRLEKTGKMDEDEVVMKGKTAGGAEPGPSHPSRAGGQQDTSSSRHLLMHAAFCFAVTHQFDISRDGESRGGNKRLLVDFWLRLLYKCEQTGGERHWKTPPDGALSSSPLFQLF